MFHFAIPICLFALSGTEMVQWAGFHLHSENLIKEVIPVKVFFFRKAALNQYTGDNSLEQDYLERGLF